MSEEIKFRAYLLNEKKMVNVHVINFIEKIIQVWHEVGHGNIEKYYDFQDIVLQQYVGLKDKNSKEIYSGDILKCSSDIVWDWYVINYYKSKFYALRLWQFKFNKKTAINEVVNCVNSGKAEIMGNIYENLNLIEPAMKDLTLIHNRYP